VLVPFAASDVPAAPVLVLMAAGAVVAVAGHASGSRRTAAIGIAMIFLATALMILLAYAAYEGGDTTDPRPQAPRGGF
jgi:4-amino-4-deoxy-L-arabinose transferase-like glycosyltransferase